MKHDVFTARLLTPAKAVPKAAPSNPKTTNATKVAEVKEKPEEKKEPVVAPVKTAPPRVVENTTTATDTFICGGTS